MNINRIHISKYIHTNLSLSIHIYIYTHISRPMPTSRRSRPAWARSRGSGARRPRRRRRGQGEWPRADARHAQLRQAVHLCFSLSLSLSLSVSLSLPLCKHVQHYSPPLVRPACSNRISEIGSSLWKHRTFKGHAEVKLSSDSWCWNLNPSRWSFALRPVRTDREEAVGTASGPRQNGRSYTGYLAQICWLSRTNVLAKRRLIKAESLARDAPVLWLC